MALIGPTISFELNPQKLKTRVSGEKYWHPGQNAMVCRVLADDHCSFVEFSMHRGFFIKYAGVGLQPEQFQSNVNAEALVRALKGVCSL